MMDEVTLTLWSCVKFEQGTISVRMASHVVDPGELSGGGANLPALMAHKELITRGGILRAGHESIQLFSLKKHML